MGYCANVSIDVYVQTDKKNDDEILVIGKKFLELEDTHLADSLKETADSCVTEF
jgi:hypothetical protein